MNESTWISKCVKEAIWIEPKRGNNAKSLMLSFRSDIPNLIDIPQESIRTKVFEYMKRPSSYVFELSPIWSPNLVTIDSEGFKGAQHLLSERLRLSA